VSESFLDGKVILHRGDCLDVLPLLEESSVDSVVTDPPYHLLTTCKRFSKSDPAKEKYAMSRKSEAFGRLTRGFMGQRWDGGGIAFNPETWALVLRVLKPGGHLLAFSGTRTYHRMACAIEDAGFEIRDQIGWCYGSGFPKSHDVSKGIDRIAGAQRELVGSYRVSCGTGKAFGKVVGDRGGASSVNVTAPATDSAIQWQGWGTALKPAWEPICLARKPISESSIAANVLKHGTGGINVDGCRIPSEVIERPSSATGVKTNAHMEWRPWMQARLDAGKPLKQDFRNDKGRWPANLIHDGSEEVLAGFPESGPPCGSPKKSSSQGTIAGSPNAQAGSNASYVGDSGSAARFFYTAKADADDRLGSKHPTVKPLDLMQYLVRLVTPPKGIVLDPFGGTGTTAEAAWRDGFRAILIEREAEYQADIVKRMGLCLAGPDQRRAATVTQLPPNDLPMFEGLA
jgi:site-specific DNA-methyltransferase (adenine-specific)